MALENAPTHLDPRLGSDAASERLYDLFASGLVRKGPRNEILPDLARSWDVLDDGRRYRFHLVPGRRFHDGRSLTARDVVWTYQTLLDGTVVSPKRGSVAPLERVELVDELTVDFVLTEPWGSLLVNLNAAFGILPDGTSPEEAAARPVGSGPFRVVEQRPDRVLLAAWDDYPGGRPKLDRIVLREVPDATVRALELEKGSVHLVVNALAPDVVPLFQDRDGFRVVMEPGSNYAYLGFNLEDPILGDLRVRRAIALAIDRGTLIETLWRRQGQATETLVPPGHWARHEQLEPIGYDPEGARRLLDEAGFPDPEGPAPRFGLTYKTSTNEPSLLQAQAIQAMLAAVGIAVEIRSHEFATFYADIKRGSFQLYSLTWTGIADPDLYRYVLHSAAIPPAGANRNRYRSARFDDLVDRAGRELDLARRRALYWEAQEVVHQDLPYLSLYTKHTVAVMSDRLEGYVSYPAGELHSLREMRWRE